MQAALVFAAGLLLRFTGSWLGRILLLLGIGLVTFTGTTVLIDSVISGIKSSFGGMTATMVNFLAWMWVDKALSMIFSAVNIALSIRVGGAAGGAIKKWLVTTPTLI